MPCRRILHALLGVTSTFLLAGPGLAVPIPPGTPTLDLVVELAWTTGIPSGPEGLAFGAGMGQGNDEDGVDRTGADVLFVSQGDSCDFGGCQIKVYTTAGKEIPGMAFSTPVGVSTGIGALRGMHMLPNGNLLVTDTVQGLNDRGRILEIHATGAMAGQKVAGGIDFQTPNSAPTGNFEPESVILSTSGRNAGANTVFIGFEERERISEYSLQFDGGAGSELAGFDFFDPPFNDPSGSAYDAVFDRIFVADDSSGGEDSKIFLFDEDGNLLAASDLLKVLTDPTTGVGDLAARQLCQSQGTALGDPPNCNDPEGLAWDPSTGFLFVAFEDQDVVLGFSTSGLIPEPGTLLLLALGLAALRARRG